MSPLVFLLALTPVVGLLVLIGIVAVIYVRRSRRSSSGKNESQLPAPALPSKEQIDFVRNKITEHRDKYLRYALYMEVISRGLPSSLLDELLNGEAQEYAAPVLFLQHDKWMWRGDQLETTVTAVLKTFNITTKGEGKTHRLASEACRRWAQAEAKKVIDERVS